MQDPSLQDLVDAGSGGERRDAVLDEGPAVEHEQLLGECRTETGARAAAEYHRHHAFHRHINPLILLSAAFTALAFIFVPLLRLHDKRPGEPARAVGAGSS